MYIRISFVVVEVELYKADCIVAISFCPRLRLGKFNYLMNELQMREGVSTWELFKLSAGQWPLCLFELKIQAVEICWERN